MIRKEDIATIGQFAKPHGIKGELTLVTNYNRLFEDTDNPYVVCEMDGIWVPFFVESFRSKSTSSLLVKLEGVNDETTAKKFTNRTVYYPADALPEDDDNESWTRFIGYMLTDEVLGEIGTVADVDESTANIVFRVDDQGKERLIPMAEEMICSIDEQGKRMIVSLPEGILDLN
ncbi:ribosome maturation factor RimM [Tannerella forsythia]|uniref:Ribosome maturation factor RimM n=1 Tax=Tannerella forsythia TaxID=28112 RepID=A0A3P1XUB3_TANFO|nr:ribosome maturation factor RimM [Tannerella forsythia]RRD62061.1 16S rRNA processing protein RimM [Tannerella forsythia]RRD74865.1 16S rRNA processing protein RimM [Tannerella forsythia]